MIHLESDRAPRGSHSRHAASPVAIRLVRGVAIAAVALIALAGCTSISTTVVPKGESSSVTRGGFTVTIHLSTTRVPRGEQIAGSLVIVNHTGRTVPIGCLRDGFLSVGIENRHVPYDPAFLSMACGSSLRPGTTTLFRRVLTTYLGCGFTGVPACSEPAIPAPLPAGIYWSATAGMGRLPSPPPIKVRLLQATQPV